MSCPSWSEPSHRGSSFQHGRGTGRGVLHALFLERRAAFRVAQHPGRRRRQRRRRIEDGGRIGEADRRPDHPAMRLDLVGDEGIAIVGPRLEAAELLLRIIDEHRKEKLALVGDQERAVVGDELGAERSGKEGEKDDERPRPSPVAAEVVEPTAVHRREFKPGARAGGGHARRRTSWPGLTRLFTRRRPLHHASHGGGGARRLPREIPMGANCVGRAAWRAASRASPGTAMTAAGISGARCSTLKPRAFRNRCADRSRCR